MSGDNIAASIVIRTLNEARWLGEVFEALKTQNLDGRPFEVVLVDSGSTDGSIEIAQENGARIVEIKKSEFTFGRSLNRGCDAALGRALVFISGHCIPTHDRWLSNLIMPLGRDRITYSYGRQIGHEVSKFSEHQLFKKYFPETSAVPQDGFFINNANSALLKSTWKNHPFDEELTGLEDMELGKRLVGVGDKIAYVADAPVIHIHEETWPKVKTRYEREAIALQAIMPEVHVGFGDFLRYTMSGVMFDWAEAISQKQFWKQAGNIVMFRTMQFWGTYKGNNDHRRMSQARKEAYFYPR